MQELTSLLIAKREKENDDRKFFAALQGVNIDEGGGEAKRNAWEDMKARVFSNGQAQNSDDILSLQGINAQKAGFGIGSGLEYSNLRDLENPSW